MISERNQLGTVVSFEALKLGRRGKVRGTMAWTAIILTTAIVPIFLGYINTASPEAFFTWVLQPSLFGLYLYFAVCILAGDSVTSEFEHKTCFITFTNPIKKSTLLLGKYLACLTVVAGALFVYYFVSSVVVYTMFGVFLQQAIASYFYSVIAGAAALGVVFLFSSVMRGSASATLSSLLMLSFGFQLISILMQMWRVEPWFILNYAAVIINVAIQPFPGNPDALVSIAVLTLYIAVTLTASVFLLNRKELS